MAQVVEYFLAVLASTLFAGASLGVYGTYTQFEGGLQLQATASELGSLAEKAVANATSRAELTLPASTLACSNRTLTLTWEGGSASQSIDASCDFSTQIPQGPHEVQFNHGSNGLAVTVS